jgi:thiamine biosynthesis lipoprotein
VGRGGSDVPLGGGRVRRDPETRVIGAIEGGGRASPGDRSEDRPPHRDRRSAEVDDQAAGRSVGADLDLLEPFERFLGIGGTDDLDRRFVAMARESTIVRFRAMGTDVSLIGPGAVDPGTAPRAGRAVRSVFEREEQRFSRFRPDSELSLVNEASGRSVELSAGFASLLRYALEAAERTGGLFDPTVLPAVIASGYDRDFDEVLAGARGALHPPIPCGRWRAVHLDGLRVFMPDGIALDLGGIAKGWTVDLAARAAVRAGIPWALVNGGGDLRIAGAAPAVSVAVEDPGHRESECARLHLRSGALATSSTMARAWGEGLHHLIDPRTGRPTAGDVVQATVWAPTCAEAEVLAKAAVVGGRAAVAHVPAAIVTGDGDLVLSMPMAEGVAA